MKTAALFLCCFTTLRSEELVANVTPGTNNGLGAGVKLVSIDAGNGRVHSYSSGIPSFDIILLVGPTEDSPSWQGFVDRAMAYAWWRAGYAQNYDPGDPSKDPTAVVSAIPLVASTLMAPSETNVTYWRDESHANGPFSKEKGNKLRALVHVRGNGTKIRPRDLRARVQELDDAQILSQRFNYSHADCSSQLRGLSYGRDGKLGGDDILTMQGSGTNLFDEIFFIGVGVSFEANVEEERGRVADFVEEHEPFRVVVEYSIKDASGYALVSSEPLLRPQLIISKERSEAKVDVDLKNGGPYKFELLWTDNPEGPWYKTGDTMREGDFPPRYRLAGKKFFKAQYTDR